jgi:hypothetical protein
LDKFEREIEALQQRLKDATVLKEEQEEEEGELKSAASNELPYLYNCMLATLGEI